MVRDAEAGDESSSTIPNDNDDLPEETGSTSKQPERVGRRSFLQVTGAAAAALVVSGTAAAQASYDTITLDPGESRQVTLGDGDTFENVLVDQSADGAVFSIKASGDEWAIRNVGFRGAGNWGDYNFHMRVSGNGVIENVYANNKSSPNEPMGMIWERPGHDGHITVRHTYIEGFGNNAGYFTNSNKRGRNGGTVSYENCYHVDNTPANYRPGGDGSLIKDCVSVIDDPNHERAYYTNGSSDKARPTWPSHTAGIRMENVHFYTNPDDVNPGSYFSLRHDGISNGSRCEVTAVDCAGNFSQDHRLFESHDGNTDLTVRNYRQGAQTVAVLGDGVPLSPEMAARGERALPTKLPGAESGSTGDPDSLEHTLTIDGSDAGRTDYSVTVDGDLEATDSIGVGDEIDSGTATGFVNGGSDTYEFSGEITELSRDGDATILVDGQEVSPEDFADEQMRTLTIDGSDADRTDYSVTVDGDLEATDSIGVGDEIDSGTATGFVNGGSDTYRFSGAVTDLSRNGNAAILVDGQEVSPEDFADEPETRTLTIDGSNAGYTDYSVTVAGDLEATDSIGVGDEIDGGTATGFVNGGSDTYEFTGEVTSLSRDGDAAILVDGQEVSPEDFADEPELPNTIAFDGQNDEEADSYSFEVSGELAYDPEASDGSPEAAVEGASATGTVADGRAAFRYSGDLVGLNVSGTISILVNDVDG